MNPTLEQVASFTSFLASPFYRKMAAQGAEATESARLQQRQEIVAERDTIVRKLFALVEEYRLKEAAALAVIERERKRHEEAVTAGQRLHAEHRGVLWPLEFRRDRIEAELRSTVSPRVAAHFDNLQDLIAAAQAARDGVDEWTGHAGLRRVWSNDQEVNARIEAISDLRRVVRDEWPLQPWSDAEIDRRVEQACADLPSIPARPAKYRVAGAA